MSFAARLLATATIERVVLVPCAVGGTWINRWVPGADLFSFAVEEVNSALRHGELAGILWHQGEADAADIESATAYSRQLTAVIEGLRAAFLDATVPFVAGEIGRFLASYGGCPEFRRVNQAVHDVCRSLPQCAVVSSDRLGHVGDFLHFDAKAARTLGDRYAKSWLRLAGE